MKDRGDKLLIKSYIGLRQRYKVEKEVAGRAVQSEIGDPWP